ncbi:phosphoribosyltransferase [Sulfurimonas sp.]|jgi:xanthine phosphoribosyltransferase|uniref:phosphoribosyltransferase n=1 Tax=Sulfurimonas sp. TaxID=2022749 RepID=UPI0025FC082E|nr:phosphoribosyltransferase family protein [Sulfurimonas sp.]MBT5934513.1 phosphoribosyltransferase [Sulfurimonas sp.]
MTYYPYETFVKDVKTLVEMTKDYNPDTLVSIARGGVTLGHAYASATDNRQLMSINSVLYNEQEKGEKCELFNIPDLSNASRVLILDDIIDSGQTMLAVVTTLTKLYPHVIIKSASIYYKKTPLIQSAFSLYEASDWIEFFWEKDFMEKRND